MKQFKKFFTILAAGTFAVAAHSQTLDSAPANAQASPKALMVAVPTDSNDQSQALVVPMTAVAGIKITDAKDIAANKTVIAKAIEGIVTSNEAQKDLKGFLASKALKSQNASNLESRDAWFSWHYRPYHSHYYYNSNYYNYSNYYYYSWNRPVYNYGGYSYYYYSYYPRGWYW